MYNQPFIIPRYYQPKPFTGLNNIFRNIKNYNWTKLINNTSKTLGIINQSIPLAKQVGPIIGNMKSLIKLASVFKDETDITPNNQTTPLTNNNTYTESPTFFIN